MAEALEETAAPDAVATPPPPVETPAPAPAPAVNTGYTFQDALKDGDFLKQAPAVRIQVLSQLDPDFAALSAPVQAAVIGKAHLQYLQSDEFAKAHPGSAGKTRGFMDQMGEFGSTLWNEAPGIVKGIGDTVGLMGHALTGGGLMGPGKAIIDAASAAGDPLKDSKANLQTAGQRFKEGNPSEGVGHAMGAIPLIGPPAAVAGEDFRRGDIGVGAAHTLELLAPSLVHLLPKGVNSPIQISNSLNATKQAAIDSLKPSVRMSAGQLSGSELTQRLEQGLKHFAGSQKIANDFYEGQQADLATKGDALVKDVSPISGDKVTTGEAGQARLQQYIKQLKNEADKNYGDVRNATANAQQTVQTGTTQSSIVGPNGQPYTTPVFQTFDAPVNLPAQRAALTPIWSDIDKLMPDAQKTYSRAYGVLKNFMESKDTYMSAMDYDQFLGAVKAITRDGTSDILSDRSQALAKQIIGTGEKSLNKALLGAGPTVPASLKAGRAAVKGYYAADEFLGSLPKEPAAVFDRFTKGGDLAVDSLRTFQKIAPNQTRMIGRTFMQGLVDKATNEGGFAGADGIKAKFLNMGDTTKNLLLGPARAQTATNFFLGAKTLLNNLQKSGTALTTIATGSTLGAAYAIGNAVVQGLLNGQWEHAARVGGEIGLGVFAIPHIAANVLFSETGSKILTGAMKLPVRSPAFKAAIAEFGGKVMAFAQQDQQDKKNAANPEGDAPDTAQTPTDIPANVKLNSAQDKANYAQYAPVAEQAAERNGVPKGLFLWQIGQESGWNPAAKNVNGSVPATGIAQFQDATAKQYHVDPTDANGSLNAAAAYMRHLYDETGDWGLALQRYGTLNKDVPPSVWQAAALAIQNSK